MEIVYTLAPAWLIALFCWAIASANLYLSCRHNGKAWPKRLKAVNWFFIGGVYAYLFLADYELSELIRISIAFLVLGEAAYHTDTFQDMVHSGYQLVKRLTRHG